MYKNPFTHVKLYHTKTILEWSKLPPRRFCPAAIVAPALRSPATPFSQLDVCRFTTVSITPFSNSPLRPGLSLHPPSSPSVGLCPSHHRCPHPPSQFKQPCQFPPLLQRICSTLIYPNIRLLWAEWYTFSTSYCTWITAFFILVAPCTWNRFKDQEGDLCKWVPQHNLATVDRFLNFIILFYFFSSVSDSSKGCFANIFSFYRIL